MDSRISRRKFLKTGLAGAGTVFAWTLISGNAHTGNGVKFSLKQGTRGCDRCATAVRKIIEDESKNAKLAKFFPDGSDVVFYVRRHKAGAEIADNAIAVGNCSRPLAAKSKAFVPGCTREIDADYVYKVLIKKLTSQFQNSE